MRGYPAEKRKLRTNGQNGKLGMAYQIEVLLCWLSPSAGDWGGSLNLHSVILALLGHAEDGI